MLTQPSTGGGDAPYNFTAFDPKGLFEPRKPLTNEGYIQTLDLLELKGWLDRFDSSDSRDEVTHQARRRAELGALLLCLEWVPVPPLGGHVTTPVTVKGVDYAAWAMNIGALEGALATTGRLPEGQPGESWRELAKRYADDNKLRRVVIHGVTYYYD